jgi:hypothetical protein
MGFCLLLLPCCAGAVLVLFLLGMLPTSPSVVIGVCGRRAGAIVIIITESLFRVWVTFPSGAAILSCHLPSHVGFWRMLNARNTQMVHRALTTNE